MKSSPDFHFTSSLIVVILLLLSITDSIASSSQSDDSLGALKNESFELALGTTILPIISNSTEESPYFLGQIKTIIGFASSIKKVYDYFDSLLNPAITPKFTVDDVMNKMDAQFTQVKGDLMEIKAKLSGQEISAYREVEMAIDGAYNDMYHKSTVDIPTRAVKLYDQLAAFMKGMLGKTQTLPDLLNTVRDLYDCGSKHMEKKMNEFIAMVHVGTGGLAFYDRVINNKEIFNGDERIKKLATSYESIRERLKNAMNSCASLDKAVVEKYINQILSVNQEAHVQTADIPKLLYKRFADIYPDEIVWVFYAAWRYDAVGGDQSGGRYARSYNIVYKGDGISGVTKNDGWTVFWVGHPQPVPAKRLEIDVEQLRYAISKEKNVDWGPYRSAFALFRSLTWGRYFSGREPVFSLMLTNPPRPATIGTPLIGERINVWQRRIDDIEWKFIYVPFPLHQFWEKVIVDFITF